jgi:hypothetical protein
MPLQFVPADTASLVAVIDVLDGEAERLGPGSHVAPIWRDWADMLRPTADEMQALAQR